jgi:hypothetical protein
VKINLAAKNYDVKDNDPAGYINVGPECKKDKTQQ